VFLSALAFSIELTFKPTYLDRMQDPELNEQEVDSQNNPDQKQEPRCDIVMKKCCGELISIGLYVLMTLLLIIGLIHQINDGKPLTGLLEFVIALIIDQVKSVPIQWFIWWTVIRRCGKFDIVDFEEWDDNVILQGGQEPSLL
jgi:hypothetical protein